MKKILMMLSILAIGMFTTTFSITAEEVTNEPTKAESAWETVSVMSQAAAEKTAESVKEGSKKAGQAIAEGSKKAA